MKNSTVGVLMCAAVLIIVRGGSANFLAYDDEPTTIDPEEDYAQDEDQRRADYHDAMDRLISQAFNQTSEASKPIAEQAKVTPADSGIDEDVKCAANRKPIPIAARPVVTISKCCPAEQSFLHESIARCKEPLRRPRLPIISREVHLYDRSCYKFGHYLKQNISVNGKCIGKHVVFNDGTLFTVIQNGSLMVSSKDQVAFYREFCLEETATSVLVAYVCDDMTFPDPFDAVDKLVIGSALVALVLTVLVYGFERNFHTAFGRMIIAHVGLLFTALLLEAALTEFEEEFYSLIVYILIGASYVIFAVANLHSLIVSQGKFQKLDIKYVAFIAFGCCIVWLISALFILVSDERIGTLCTVFSSLVLSVLANMFSLRRILTRRHHLLTAMDSCYEFSESIEESNYVHHQKELNILSTFAAILQLLHWILFAADRYRLLYCLSWCGLTVFAVFVCFRFRSITVLACCNGGAVRTAGNGFSKEMRHHHRQPQHLQLSEEPDSNETTGNEYNQWNNSSAAPHIHQQRDNQKHTLATVAEEDGLHDEESRNGHARGLNGMGRDV
ncbi:uncharacterized protein LOC129771721 [Toxorhynchites rutilus septentrionalis]|uniref:uncharacterized protein LOC129771721 n=1 Tax=Toxorhynchites rutilus septentrionalis TaxID=329112 RepID=UPI002478C73F|nr:uncharacterized protein LOC129771721 [Toxorhynchites rutilus septentrionalis]